jgi:hypothetical protein
MATHREPELRHAANVIATAARDLGLASRPDEWAWEEQRPEQPATPERAPAPAEEDDLAAQMPSAPLSIDFEEAA